MKGIRIYIEGGGEGKRQKGTLRTGFQVFLKPLRDAARAQRLNLDVVMCGGRQTAYRDYLIALRHHTDSLNVLLVDAEGPVADSPWRHLAAGDGWDDPGVGDDCCHLMVQMVEAWLIADPDALEQYYGQGFRRSALPSQQDVEAISKQDLLRALEHASAHTSKQRYRKIQDCSALLARVSVAKVRHRAAHCERLFDTLERMLRDSDDSR